MVNIFMKILIPAMLLSFSTGAFAGESIKLLYRISIYADNKGGALKQPEGVACNDTSLLVIADTGRDRLLRFTFQDGALKGGDEIAVPQLAAPLRVQVNARGDIFVLDGKQRRIVKLNAGGAFVGYLAPEGLPAPVSLIPRNFRVDADGTAYILDIFSMRVLIVDSSGRYRRHIELPEGYETFSDLAVDAQGTVYVLDSSTATIFSASKDAKEFSPFTKSLSEYLTFPSNLFIDDKGVFFVTDQNAGRLAILGKDGSFQGHPLNAGWKEGLLRFPSQLCVNSSGEVFIADRDNSRVQIFSAIR